MNILFSYLIYLILLRSIILLLHFKNKKYYNIVLVFTSDKYSQITFNHLLALTLIAFIVGFRYNVGTDWDAYRLYFQQRDFEAGKWELGYRVINQFVYWLKGHYTHVFFIVAFISWYFIFKSYPVQLLPLGIYFLFCDEWYFFSNNLVRQFVALAIFLYAVKFLANKNIKQFIIWILIAGLFHSTAWFFIPLFLIPWKKLYNHRIWLIIYLITFLFSQNETLIDIFPRIFDKITEHIPILNAYLSYFNTKFYNIDEVSIGSLGILFRALVGLYIIYFSKDVIVKYPQTKIYFLLFFIGMIITNLFLGITIISRFAFYFIFFRPFLLALIVYFSFKYTKSEIQILLSGGIVLLYFILFLYVISINPYDSIFFHH